MKLTPLWHNVLIKKVSRRPEWIILTKVDEDYDNRWEVIATWPWALREDGKRSEMPVKAWEIVHFSQYDKQIIKLDEDEEYFIVNASKILAIELKDEQSK